MEGMGDMSRNKDALNTHVNPGNGKVLEVYPLVFLVLTHMRFEDKLVDAICLAKAALVILTIMFVCVFGF
jgi:hypothetical protein